VSRSYRVNEPAVAAELHDGDAILINFENGRYYDTSGAGGEIVRLLLEAHTVGEIANEMARLSGAAESEVVRAIDVFVEALIAEGLIVPTTAPKEPRVPGAISCALAQPFVAPGLNRHLELEDLLQLDPIHDADEAGWPLPKASEGKAGDGG
jgi:hypothetical protein